MNNTDAIKELEKLAKQREELMAAVRRKKSWRPSEQALTLASYGRQLDALDYAIGALRAISGATEAKNDDRFVGGLLP